ncbi:L-aminoadipate-semialdehyde dehydrogenase-phosphopantetheinyl transferase-like [Tigriopus californicus]|uniref:L-aminoadipate-semialdehyde dehydrogenase-phosphopantetheinyl transferase-like n=1 Tax=Tigriopus californicus TaxID=6832 RepID=UPI0027DA07A3|nr:L-aminoadipate-semialdehyde dehydrogenase-phosphopantetheinyl transferase-like [Tigriopus californicus]
MSSINIPVISLRWAFHVARWQPSPLQWRRACAGLDPEEVERISQFQYQSDAKASLVGQIMFRRAAWDSLHGLFQDIHCLRSPKGKPQVVCDGVIPLWFDANVAHQGDWVVLAAEFVNPQDQVRVGVDVMRLNDQRGDINRFFHLMKRKFTPLEWVMIRNPKDSQCCSAEEQLRMFYRYWALKESFVKADGLGLGWNLQKIQFHITSPLPSCDSLHPVQDTCVQVLGAADETSKWTFQELILKDGQHCMSVAIKNDNTRNVSSTITRYVEDFEDLIPVEFEDELSEETWDDNWKKFCQMQVNKDV